MTQINETAHAGADTATPLDKTTNLLGHLLGQAFVDRYADFCHLASGKSQLRVSRPIAAHSLRELESSLRQTLKLISEVRPAATTKTKALNLALADQALRKLGFDKSAIQRAIKALPEQCRHRDEILGIINWLGLPQDGEVANT